MHSEIGYMDIGRFETCQLKIEISLYFFFILWLVAVSDLVRNSGSSVERTRQFGQFEIGRQCDRISRRHHRSIDYIHVGICCARCMRWSSYRYSWIGTVGHWAQHHSRSFGCREWLILVVILVEFYEKFLSFSILWCTDQLHWCKHESSSHIRPRFGRKFLERSMGKRRSNQIETKFLIANSTDSLPFCTFTFRSTGLDQSRAVLYPAPSIEYCLPCVKVMATLRLMIFKIKAACSFVCVFIQLNKIRQKQEEKKTRRQKILIFPPHFFCGQLCK